jgi:hypothetical protein
METKNAIVCNRSLLVQITMNMINIWGWHGSVVCSLKYKCFVCFGLCFASVRCSFMNAWRECKHLVYYQFLMLCNGYCSLYWLCLLHLSDKFNAYNGWLAKQILLRLEMWLGKKDLRRWFWLFKDKGFTKK